MKDQHALLVKLILKNLNIDYGNTFYYEDLISLMTNEVESLYKKDNINIINQQLYNEILVALSVLKKEYQNVLVFHQYSSIINLKLAERIIKLCNDASVGPGNILHDAKIDAKKSLEISESAFNYLLFFNSINMEDGYERFDEILWGKALNVNPQNIELVNLVFDIKSDFINKQIEFQDNIDKKLLKQNYLNELKKYLEKYPDSNELYKKYVYYQSEINNFD